MWAEDTHRMSVFPEVDIDFSLRQRGVCWTNLSERPDCGIPNPFFEMIFLLVKVDIIKPNNLELNNEKSWQLAHHVESIPGMEEIIYMVMAAY